MIGFDLERHVPFPAEDIRFAGRSYPGPPRSHTRAGAAAERRTVEGPLALLAGAKRRPRSSRWPATSCPRSCPAGSRPARGLVHRHARHHLLFSMARCSS